MLESQTRRIVLDVTFESSLDYCYLKLNTGEIRIILRYIYGITETDYVEPEIKGSGASFIVSLLFKFQNHMLMPRKKE